MPPAAAKARSYTSWSKSFVDALYRGETLELRKSPSLGAWSNPSEPERDFRIRLQQAAKEARDAELDRLRAKYAPKLAALRREESAAPSKPSPARPRRPATPACRAWSVSAPRSWAR